MASKELVSNGSSNDSTTEEFLTQEDHVTTQSLQKENEQLKRFLQEKDRAIESKQKKLHQLGKQLQEKQLQLQAKEQQLREKKAAISALESQVQQLNEKLGEKSDQLKSHRPKTQEETLDQIEEEVEEGERGEEKEGGEAAKKDTVVASQPPELAEGSVQLTWQKSGKAPCDMRRGTSAVSGSIAYFAPFHSVGTGETNVFAYDSDQDEWSNQPQCPQQHFTFTVVNGHLTAVGGERSFQPVSTLVTLSKDSESGEQKWIEKFPPMPTKRFSTAVACSSRSLVVAGGQAGPRPYDRLSTVELMDTENLQWSAVCNLPKPFTQASVAICGDKLYLVGGVEENGKTKEVLSCSLEGLRKTARMQGRRTSIGARLRNLSRSEARQITENGTQWKRIDNLPAYLSTCVAFAGHLVAVGGYSDLSNGPTSAVRIFNAQRGGWDVGTDLPTARYLCMVVALPGDRLMAVGGAVGVISDCDAVEVASLH